MDNFRRGKNFFFFFFQNQVLYSERYWCINKISIIDMQGSPKELEIYGITHN